MKEGKTRVREGGIKRVQGLCPIVSILMRCCHGCPILDPKLLFVEDDGWEGVDDRGIVLILAFF